MKKYINCIYVVLCTYLLLPYAAIGIVSGDAAILIIGTKPKPSVKINDFNNFTSIGSIAFIGSVGAPIDYSELAEATRTTKNPFDFVATASIDKVETTKTTPSNKNPNFIAIVTIPIDNAETEDISTDPDNIKVTPVDFQVMEEYTSVQLTPVKKDLVYSTYEYFIVTVVVEKGTSFSTPMNNIPTFKSITRKHFYITPMTKKMSSNISTSFSTSYLSYFFSLPSKNEKAPPRTYYTISSPAADDDEDPPFPLPLPGVGDITESGEKINLNDDGTDSATAYYLLLNTNEQSDLSPRLIHSFKMIETIETARQSLKKSEASLLLPPPLPRVDKENQYILIATHANDEDPPFPLPLPGVGNTVEEEGIKEEIITDVYQYILIPIKAFSVDYGRR
jgi:hypothetical protein